MGTEAMFHFCCVLGLPLAFPAVCTVATAIRITATGGNLHAFAYQQVSGGPHGVFDGGKGEPLLCKVLFFDIRFVTHPIEHQLCYKDLPRW